jgi:predicted lysophospholipase L1 biosynthesis ABC-type transport system permease subunit
VTESSATGSASIRAYWVLRALETALLLAALASMGVFAWSIVDIFRTGAMPFSVWPGIAAFLVAMVLLQVVRGVLERHRREDGSPRADARGIAAAATAEVLGEDSDGADRSTDDDQTREL